ncbi:MAG: FAD-dependent oxidoreductase [Deltaproteobacteria bacterium]|jgi:NADPH-dependent glutamate synthase beta subunit-like oxidoreductase|nr:FAD-dependent oxidoreductase [Deltaproteobacteria bacterium]
MELHQYQYLEAKCGQNDLPRCAAECPIHVDVRGMLQEAKRGNFSKAYALFAQTVPFPGIISQVCEQPCQQVCIRNDIDDGLAINAIERACYSYNEKKGSRAKLLLQKDNKVAVVGSGISGLTVAYHLANKGIKITVFEAGNNLGGRLLELTEGILNRRIMLNDLEVLNDLHVEIRLGVAINNSCSNSFNELLQEFDAVYLGLGQRDISALKLGLELNSNGTICVDPTTMETSNSKVFAGGSHLQDKNCLSVISSVADGKSAVISIDRFLQKASLTASRHAFGSKTTRLLTSVDSINPQPMVPISDPAKGYTEEEAKTEASRCIDCQCLECFKLCEYMRHFKMEPRALARQIFKNSSAIAHRFSLPMNSCSLCRQCEAVCQYDFSIADFCEAARETMVKAGRMPPSAFGFAIQDLKYSNSEAFVLTRLEPERSEIEYVFYPGCQLSGSAPWQVSKAYSYLREKISGGVGLMLGCCGVQASWAGETGIFQESLASFRSKWTELGKPGVIAGCPTCYMVFKKHLPELSVDLLSSIFDKFGLPEPAQSNSLVLAIHDSCTTRYEIEIQNSIRKILNNLGHTVKELTASRELTECCGFGGLMQISNRSLAHKVVDRRIEESEYDYLVYCSMCRDNFTNRGKTTYHLLDLIFGDEDGKIAARPPVGYSRRHDNRARLKNTFLKEVWGEDISYDPTPVKLIISEALRSVMENSLILDFDLYRVIEYAERTGNKLQNIVSGHYLAYFKPENVTYWVEYTAEGSGYVIHDAYSHRLEMTSPGESENDDNQTCRV